MRLAIVGFLCSVAALGCVTPSKGWQDTAPRFTEPKRSQFVLRCIMSGMPSTHCLCVEHGLVREYGSIEKAFKGDDETISSIHKKCHSKLKDAIKLEMEEEERREEAEKGI